MSAGRLVSSTRCANGGGSSSVLSILLATWSLIVSARSSTKTRRRASNRVRAGGGDHGLVDVAHEHLGGAAGHHPGQVRVRPVLDASGDRLGVGGAVGQQRGGERARDGALAGARRTVEEIGMRG